MEALRVEDLKKSFGGVQAVAGVTFDVAVGEHLVIIGPNGAGKTTLLNLINGQWTPSGGRIEFFGRDVTRMSTHRRSHLGMARAFQTISLLANLSLLENVLLTLYGTTPYRFRMFMRMEGFADIVESARRILSSLDLWARRDEPLNSISYGEQRRLEISLGLALEPKMLLLDEPSAGLTKEESQVVVDIIRNLAEDQTLLIVDHDMELVFEVASRIIVLHQGLVIADGPPGEIQNDQRVREVYMGVDE